MATPWLQPWQSLYWGGGRVVSLEQPGRWGAVVDMPAHAAAEDWAALTKQILSQVEEDQIAIRGGEYARRAPTGTNPGHCRLSTTGSRTEPF